MAKTHSKPDQLIKGADDKCRWLRDPKDGFEYFVPGCYGGAVYGDTENHCTCYPGVDIEGKKVWNPPDKQNVRYVNLTIKNIVDAYKKVIERVSVK